MDAEVEKFVKTCRDCTLVSNAFAPEPLIRTAMPEKPWVHIAVDFMGPLPSGHNLLVIVDYYSRFVEVIVMKEISAKSTILALHETFCRYGIPVTMKSDNGPQFVSEAVQDFCREYVGNMALNIEKQLLIGHRPMERWKEQTERSRNVCR